MFIRAVLIGLLTTMPLQGVSASVVPETSTLAPPLFTSEFLGEEAYIQRAITVTLENALRSIKRKDANSFISDKRFKESLSDSELAFNIQAEAFTLQYFIKEICSLYEDEEISVYRIRCKVKRDEFSMPTYHSIEFSIKHNEEMDEFEVLDYYPGDQFKVRNPLFYKEGKRQSDAIKVTLVMPSDTSASIGAGSRKGIDNFLPLGIASIAGNLRDWAKINKVNLDIQVIDTATMGYSNYDVLKKIKEFKPDLLGLSVLSPSVKNATLLSETVRKILPETIVIWGGDHVVSKYDEVKSLPFVDIVVLGEGETKMKQMVDVLKDVDRSRESFMDKIESLNGIMTIKQREKLSKLSEPAYDMFPMDLYNWRNIATVSAESHRGCPGRCSFCIMPEVFKGVIETQQPEYFVNQVTQLNERYGVDYFYIVDDNFTTNKKWIHQVADLIEQRGIDVGFEIYSRADFIAKDTSIVKDLKKMGVKAVFVGIESGNADILREYDKKINFHNIETTIKALGDEGITVIAAFIVGAPNDNQETIQQSIKYANHLKTLAPIVLHLTHLVPYPGTPIYKQAVDSGLLGEEDWQYFDPHGNAVMGTNFMTKEEVDEWKIRFLRNFYDEEHIRKLRASESLHNVARGFIDLVEQIDRADTLVDVAGEMKEAKKAGKIAGTQVKTNYHDRQKLIVPFEFYGNRIGEFRNDVDKYSDRFFLDYVDEKEASDYIEAVIVKSKEMENRTVALVPRDTPKTHLRKLKANGIRFILIDKEEYFLHNVMHEDDKTMREDIYSIMLLYRSFSRKNDKPYIEQLLKFFLESRFDLKGMDIETMMDAIDKEDVDKLSKAILLVTPIEKYRKPEYFEVSQIIMSA